MSQKYNAVIDVTLAAPVAEAITVSDVKNWLKIDLSDDDALIATLITAARIVIEDYVNLSLGPRDIVAQINNGLGNFILPYGPVNSIVSQTNLLGVAQNYTTQGNVINECFDEQSVVTYNGGYTTLPANLRIAWLQQIAYMYEHRGDELAGDLSPIIRTNLKAIRRI